MNDALNAADRRRLEWFEQETHALRQSHGALIDALNDALGVSGEVPRTGLDKLGSAGVWVGLHRLIAAADERYGTFASAHEALGVALEEWDELRVAIRCNDIESIRSEALDLAAVLVRLWAQLGEDGAMRDRSVK